MQGFKYSESRYRDSLLALGNLRVGTLHDFRRQEHKNGIADVAEGTKSVFHQIFKVTERDIGSPDYEAMRIFDLFSLQGPDSTVSGLTLEREFDFEDCFVHCTSSIYSNEVLSQFEGADACIEIHNLEGFYARLTETINRQFPVQFVGCHKVSYSARREGWNGKDWGDHPALMKAPNYSLQEEIRAVWLPRRLERIYPFNLNDVGLIKFCCFREAPIRS
jgi:hypothetical protein